jgi:hypothetical protein
MSSMMSNDKMPISARLHGSVMPRVEITKVCVVWPDGDVNDATSMAVEIVSRPEGAFLQISHVGKPEKSVTFLPDEWAAIQEAVEMLMRAFPSA